MGNHGESREERFRVECLTCGVENVAGIFVCNSCGQNPSVPPQPVQVSAPVAPRVAPQKDSEAIETSVGVCPDANCGADIEDGATNCRYCGTTLNTAGSNFVLELNGERLSIESSLVVGRDKTLGFGPLLAANDLVSRRHFEVTWDGNSAVVVDLGSTNGTYCDGDKVEPNRQHMLKNGNVLRIGKTGPCILVKISEGSI